MSGLATAPARITRQYRYLDWLINLFVVVLLVSNLIAPKIAQIGQFKISGSLMLFPVTYIFGDVFTEVYGYAASRRAIWTGFVAAGLLSVLGLLAVLLPAAPEWKDQAAFQTVFGVVPRVIAASLIAYWAGEFANSYTMAKMKLWTEGKYLWTRTVGSTVVGQMVDTTLVVTLLFAGDRPPATIVNIIISSYIFKVIYEVAATPITYQVVGFLKRNEKVDVFDRNTDFSPFHA